MPIIPGRAFWPYLRFFLYLLYYFEVGLFLIVAPWAEGWDRQVALLSAPGLTPWLRSGYMRGGVSAVGLIHLVWGVLEALSAARGARAAGGSAEGG